jgi:hypothetical protein
MICCHKVMLYSPTHRRFLCCIQELIFTAGSSLSAQLKISYYVLSRQQEFKTFKGIAINKLRNWPRARKPVGLSGGI